MIKHIKKDLFTAPRGSILLHATNCKGVWGNGIAKTFAIKYPKAYREYEVQCRNSGTHLAGKALLIPTANYTIGCLFTSKKYGIFKDDASTIIKNTENALVDFVNQMNQRTLLKFEVHLPKINSGLFAVPWKDTEKLIRDVDNAATKKGYEIIWNIYSK